MEIKIDGSQSVVAKDDKFEFRNKVQVDKTLDVLGMTNVSSGLAVPTEKPSTDAKGSFYIDLNEKKAYVQDANGQWIPITSDSSGSGGYIIINGSSSIKVDKAGANNNLSARISEISDNILTVQPDGLYVPPDVITHEYISSAANTDTVKLNVTSSGVLTAQVPSSAFLNTVATSADDNHNVVFSGSGTAADPLKANVHVDSSPIVSTSNTDTITLDVDANKDLSASVNIATSSDAVYLDSDANGLKVILNKESSATEADNVGSVQFETVDHDGTPFLSGKYKCIFSSGVPQNISKGELYFDEETTNLYLYDGTSSVPVSPLNYSSSSHWRITNEASSAGTAVFDFRGSYGYNSGVASSAETGVKMYVAYDKTLINTHSLELGRPYRPDYRGTLIRAVKGNRHNILLGDTGTTNTTSAYTYVNHPFVISTSTDGSTWLGSYGNSNYHSSAISSWAPTDGYNNNAGKVKFFFQGVPVVPDWSGDSTNSCNTYFAMNNYSDHALISIFSSARHKYGDTSKESDTMAFRVVNGWSRFKQIQADSVIYHKSKLFTSKIIIAKSIVEFDGLQSASDGGVVYGFGETSARDALTTYGKDPGRQYYTTDDNRVNVYNNTTSAWDKIAYLSDIGGTSTSWYDGAYATADRPTSAVAGQYILDTDLGYIVWFNGTNWINATGAIV